MVGHLRANSLDAAFNHKLTTFAQNGIGMEVITEQVNKIDQIIIEKATILLVTTDMPVEEISRQLQFSSCSYFRKIFKKHTNMTPREMRKSNNI